MENVEDKNEEIANQWNNNVILVLDPEQQARKSHNASQRKYIAKIKTDDEKLKILKE